MGDETYQTGGIILPPGPPHPDPWPVQHVETVIPISTELIQDWPGSLTDIIRGMLDGTHQPAPSPPEPDTPAGHLALLAALRMDRVLRAVVELHAPRWTGWWCCDGCDMGSHAEDNPDWPCSTVTLIAQELGVELGGEHG